MVFKLPKFFSSYGEWLEREQSSILSAATIIGVSNMLAGLTALLKYRVVLGLFGGAELSAATLAAQVPDMIYKLIVFGAMSAAFIPVFTHYKKQGDEEAFRMTSALMNIVLCIFLIFAGIVVVFASPLAHLQAGSAFTPEQIVIATNLTKIMLAAQFFLAISSFLGGILQSYKRFILPSLASIIYNVGIMIGSWFFAPTFGIYAIGIGYVLGAFLHMAIQLPSVWRIGFRYRFLFQPRHAGVRRVAKLTPARIFTLGISEVQDLFLGKFVTSISTTSLLILNLAVSLMTQPIRLIGTPIGQAALPFLSDESDQKDLIHFRDLVLKLIHQISFFVFPASVLLLILRVPIVRIVFGVQELPWSTTLITARVVAIISVSIAAQAIVQLLIRAFYALKNTRTPLYISIVTAALTVAGTWFFVFVMKMAMTGVAIAISTAAIVEMLLFLYFLDRRVKGFARMAFWVPQFKMITASFLMVVFLYLPFRILDELVFNTSKTVELILLTIVTSTIGMVVYIYFAALFDVRELYIVRNILNKFSGWKKILGESDEVIVETSVQSDEV
jgi:putative peptidoglycan lipid II flippase